ncbi:hypothetical protein K431DRAFT_296709 [Polychaeton citri CBS 116435]|uniref:Uncharacterized protein n=1 Tax=Polychaeton citri CBS 116435 TaxID=1314669 RepID=A0A9P4Q5B2_9PEZI|nr:hypothetical protein K431DRAFT_296709 [Polychaeton citri CBS 116435]
MASSVLSAQTGIHRRVDGVLIDDLQSPRPLMCSTLVPSSSKPFHLPPADVNRLAVALAASPLFQKTARRQWYDCQSDEPSSNTSIGSPSPKTEATPNVSSPSSESPDSILTSKTPIPPPQPMTAMKRRALVDAKVRSNPVLSTAQDDFEVESAFRVGTCLAFDVPYGASRVKSLNITRLPTDKAGLANNSIKLRLADVLVEQNSRKKGLMLATEIDLTTVFKQAALCELLTSTGIDASGITAPDPIAQSLNSPVGLGQCVLADELADRRRVIDLLGQAVCTLSHLTPQTCTQETLGLVSLLESLREEQQAVLMLRTSDPWRDGGALGEETNIPWISSYLYDLINEDEESQECGGDFLLAVKQGVQERLSGKVAFSKVIRWKMGQTMVEYFPLVDGVGEQIGAWICVADLM